MELLPVQLVYFPCSHGIMMVMHIGLFVVSAGYIVKNRDLFPNEEYMEYISQKNTLEMLVMYN